MKKFLLLLAVLTSIAFSATEDSKTTFLKLYYSGKFKEAHALLKSASLRENKIWEERLHIHEQIPECDFHSDSSQRAAALLEIGLIDQARRNFKDDWLSLLSRAKLASWKNDVEEARSCLNRAIQLRPNDPELLYYAGQYAQSNEEAVTYYQKYLRNQTADPLKSASARQSLAFIQKTQGIQLNQSRLSSTVETIDSRFDQKKLTIRAKIDTNREVVLLIDTGAAGLSLKDKNWKARVATDLTMVGLGARQRTRAALVIFDQFQAGKFEMKNPVAALSPTLYGSGIDGIAGAIIFSRYNILLPLNNDTNITLSTLKSNELLEQLGANGQKFSRKITLPFYQVGKMIIVKGKIKKSDDTMDILLDTGAQTSILSAAAARKYAAINYRRTYRQKTRSHLTGIGGRIDNLLHVDNVDIEVGPIRKSFNRMVALNLSQISEALELEVDLILGQDFLKGYTLLIDYKNNQVTFLS